MKNLLSLLFIAGFFALFTSCDAGLQGELSENQPPNTNLTVGEINRSGANRLPSQIQISWWGTDPDGYIVGYEFSINNSDWQYTTKSDSIFILPIPQGDLTADVDFRVRAVDNEDARDPEPAQLSYPIINSPPDIEIDFTKSPPDTTYNIASFGWIASDPDGELNLDNVQISINSLDNWQDLSSEIEFITLRIDDNVTTAETTADVLLGESFIETQTSFSGIRLESLNTLYVRSVDRAGATSEPDSVQWFVRKRTSRILVINDIQSADGTYFRRDFHIDQLNEAGISNIDVWNMNGGEVGAGQRLQLSEKFFDNSVLGTVGALAIEQWDYIYFLSTDFNRNLYYAPAMLSRFLNNGGNLFIHSAPRAIDEQHPLFGFLPIDGLTPQESSRGFIINLNSDITPVGSFTVPNLTTEENILGANPIIVSAGSNGIMQADFRSRERRGTTDFTGNEIIAAQSGEGNIIYFSLDLQVLNGSNNVADVISAICIDELGFQQD